MSKRDRTTLGGLVLAMIVGVGGSLGLAASCLGRDKAHRGDDDTTTMTTYPEDRSARTSSGGVPGEEAIGTTEITSVELPAGAPNTAPNNAATNAPPPSPAPAAQTPPRATNAPPPTPNATANTTVNVHVNRDGVTTTTTSGGDAGATTPEPASTQDQNDQARDGGGGTSMNGTQPQPQSTAPPIPPRPFVTEPNAFGGASTWTPNHEAGAGPFTTEQNVPNNPGP